MRWFIAVVVGILACLQTLALAQEGELVATESALDSGSSWSAELSWENAVGAKAQAGIRTYAYDLRAVPELALGRFTLGGDFTLHGERNSLLQDFALDDTLLYAKFSAFGRGGLILGPKLDLTLPTHQARRRDEMFRGAPGAGFFAEWTHAFGMLEWESNVLRALRRQLPAAAEPSIREGETPAEMDPSAPATPILPTLSRWELFHELIATFTLVGRLDLSQRVRWTRTWSGDKAKADVFTSEQLLGHDWDSFRLELGHLFERELRSRSGERKPFAISGSAESQVVGNLILRL